MINLFAYGGLMLPDNLYQLTGQRFDHCPARLRGYARLRVGRECRPGITPYRNASTQGVVFFDMSKHDIEQVSRFLCEDYQVRPVRLTVSGSTIVTAVTHVPTDYQARQWSFEPWCYERLCRVYSQSDTEESGTLVPISAIAPRY